MKYTNTHAHLYRNKCSRLFCELAAGDKFTESEDSKFYCKIDTVINNAKYANWQVYNAVRLETGELAHIDEAQKCIVAKDVRIDAKF